MSSFTLQPSTTQIPDEPTILCGRAFFGVLISRGIAPPGGFSLRMCHSNFSGLTLQSSPRWDN